MGPQNNLQITTTALQDSNSGSGSPCLTPSTSSEMASLLTPSPLFKLRTQMNPHSHRLSLSCVSTSTRFVGHGARPRSNCNYSVSSKATSIETDDVLRKQLHPNNHDFGVVGMHHVGILCQNLERSLQFYQNILGLEINEARPHDKLPYRGAWLWVGSEMIHLMELPNPDPMTGRPEHGGRDRHTCIAIRDVSKLKEILDKAGIPYTLSRSGRPAIFTRDPDTNALEFTQVDV